MMDEVDMWVGGLPGLQCGATPSLNPELTSRDGMCVVGPVNEPRDRKWWKDSFCRDFLQTFTDGQTEPVGVSQAEEPTPAPEEGGSEGEQGQKEGEKAPMDGAGWWAAPSVGLVALAALFAL